MPVYRRGYAGATVATSSPSVGSQAPSTLQPSPIPGGTGLLPNQPTVPGSTVVLTNPYTTHVVVYITGGTVTVIKVNGTATGFGSTGVTVIIPAGGTITMTYSAAPSWKWFGF